MTNRFDLVYLPLPGLILLKRKPTRDSRGYFERLFCSEELHSLIPGKHIVQINHSITTNRSTVRGLHFQHPPYSDIKFVSCLRGEVFDVTVDLRHNSPTFLHWHGELLNFDNHKTLVIPEGFAHGFQTLTDECEMVYFHTSSYQPEAEDGLHVQDPRLAITWPLPVARLSSRDVMYQKLEDNFCGLML